MPTTHAPTLIPLPFVLSLSKDVLAQARTSLPAPPLTPSRLVGATLVVALAPSWVPTCRARPCLEFVSRAPPRPRIRICHAPPIHSAVGSPGIRFVSAPRGSNLRSRNDHQAGPPLRWPDEKTNPSCAHLRLDRTPKLRRGGPGVGPPEKTRETKRLESPLPVEPWG